MTKPLTACQRHLHAICDGKVTRTNVIGMRKLINTAEREMAGWSVPKSAPDLQTVWDLETMLEGRFPRVEGELHDTGLKVLRNPRYAKRWTDWQSQAIDAADHFRLVRFDRIGRIGRNGEYAVPVYALWSKIPPKGDALDGGTYEAFWFRNIPWQSGGDGPEVVA